MKRPDRIDTKREARAWLEWAASADHPPGCQCRGCARSRDILAGRESMVPQPMAEGSAGRG